MNVFPAIKQRPVKRRLHIAYASAHVHVNMDRLACDPPPALNLCAVKKVRHTDGFDGGIINACMADLRW